MAMERVLEYGTEEYSKLVLAARMAELISPNHYRYVVQDTYLDYGQDWKWTTIIANPEGKWGGYQALNPREWKEIVMATTPEQILATVREMFVDKFCPDREERN